MSKHRWRGIARSLGVHPNLVLWNSYSNIDRMQSVFNNYKNILELESPPYWLGHPYLYRIYSMVIPEMSLKYWKNETHR